MEMLSVQITGKHAGVAEIPIFDPPVKKKKPLA
jgi:hypothetical protein